MKRWTTLLCAAAVLVGLNVYFATASAQVTKGKSRPAATKHLMKGIVFPNCAALGKALKDKGPTDDKAWEAAAAQAACLNEASFLLMDDGRCPDGVWAKAAKTTLREGSAKLMAAIDKKDLAGAQAAFKATTQSCKACHTKHKK